MDSLRSSDSVIIRPPPCFSATFVNCERPKPPALHPEATIWWAFSRNTTVFIRFPPRTKRASN